MGTLPLANPDFLIPSNTNWEYALNPSVTGLQLLIFIYKDQAIG